MATQEDAWREKLTPEQYAVCRLKGTEPAFTGRYDDHHAQGTYHCVACGRALFASSAKYDSHSGWPSFFQPVAERVVHQHEDRSHGMVRTEISCGNCGSHLGHVFPDGPPPTGLRYCINSVALDFHPSHDNP